MTSGLIQHSAKYHHRNVRTARGAQSASYSVATAVSPWLKRLVSEADHYLHLVLRLRMSGAIPPLPHVTSCEA